MKAEQISLFDSRDLQAYTNAIHKQDAKLVKETLNLVLLFEDMEIDWGFEEKEINKAAHEYSYMKFEGMKEEDIISWLSTRYKRKRIEIQLLILYLQQKKKDSR